MLFLMVTKRFHTRTFLSRGLRVVLLLMVTKCRSSICATTMGLRVVSFPTISKRAEEAERVRSVIRRRKVKIPESQKKDGKEAR